MRRRNPAPMLGNDQADSRPVGYDETFIAYTVPMILAAGHPLRGARCLLCASLVGSALVRFVQVIIAADMACHCGNLVTISQLVCAGHGEPDPAVVVAAAIRRMAVVHGDQACERQP